MVSWHSCNKRLCAAVFLGVVAAQGALAVPILSIAAVPDPAVFGTPLTLDLLVTGVSDLYGYNFSLSFDPHLLNAIGSTEGSFLTTGGATSFYGGTIDNAAGTISFGFDTLLSHVPGVTGSGTLAHLMFNVLGGGTTALTFSDVLFVDSNSALLSVQAQDRNLLVLAPVPEPATVALMAIGLAGLAAMRRRKTMRP